MIEPGERVLVCGGRDFTDYDTLERVLDGITLKPPGLDLIIHGGARGADALAARYAACEGVPVLEFPADWRKHGRAAGAIRNQQMLDEGKPTLVVALPGGRGTADMVRRARAAGLPVREVA